MDGDERRDVGLQTEHMQPPLSREESNVKKKRQSSAELKKLDASYKNWEAAKKHFREADLERTTSKIQLQRQLIQRRAEYAEQQRLHKERQITKERHQAIQQKKDRENALLKICHESIRRDKELALLKKRQQSMRGSTRDNLTTRSMAFTSSSGETMPDSREWPRRRTHLLSTGSTGILDSAPHMGGPLTEEDEETERQTTTSLDELTNLTEEEFNSLPDYKRFLYEYFGAKADRYLHPKPDQKSRHSLSSKLKERRLNPKESHLGADELWYLLRGDSNQKLLKVDGTIPLELKEAFGAFVRQFIHPKREPVSRNFSSNEDVPNLARLMDHRVLARVRELRHKVELMYRSSQNNKDRTDVLSLNNPLPDFGESSQDASVGRYIPSWLQAIRSIDSEAWEQASKKSASEPNLTLESDASLNASAEAADSAEEAEKESDGEQEAEDHLPELPVSSRAVSRPGRSRASADTPATQASAESWDFMLVKKKLSQPKRIAKFENLPRKIHFMKEAEAVVSGQFTQRHKETAEAAAHVGEYKGDSADFKQRGKVPQRQDSGGSARRGALQKQTTQWAPLSLQAVTEYTPVRQGSGLGDYKQGRVPIWAAQTSVAAN